MMTIFLKAREGSIARAVKLATMADGSDDDDNMISAEDIDFYQEQASTASFLMREQGMDPENNKKTKQKAMQREVAARKKERAMLDKLQGRGKGKDDADVSDDDAPRHSKLWQDEEEQERKQALPVKLADGSMKKVMREHALPDPDTVVQEPAMSKRAQKKARGERVAEKRALERGEVYIKPSDQPAVPEPAAEPEGKKGKKDKKDNKGPNQPVAEEDKPLTHEEKKISIADHCSKLMHEPEKNISSLSRLHQFCSDADTIIVKMALLSEAMVFSDILPDYRIRLPTEKEKEMKVSKEVAQQRAYESQILGGYQRFLQFLEAIGRKSEGEAKIMWEIGDEAALQGCTLGIVVNAMSMLQKRRPTFNFANNLLQVFKCIHVHRRVVVYLWRHLCACLCLCVHISMHI